MSPKAKSYEYYYKKQASLLGFGIYYLDTNEKDKVSIIRVNILSDNLEQDAEAVIRAFRFLRNQQFYKELEKKKINIFCDTGFKFKILKFISQILKSTKPKYLKVHILETLN